MYQISAKIYYKVSTGDILIITPEMQNSEKPLTKEEELNLYQQFKNLNALDIDFIELKYGTLATTFNNAKSYKVNLDTKQLEVIYYTEDELSSMQEQSKEVESLNNRVSDISSYLMDSDDSTISSVEDTVLEIELNKISKENGGM